MEVAAFKTSFINSKYDYKILLKKCFPPTLQSSALKNGSAHIGLVIRNLAITLRNSALLVMQGDHVEDKAMGRQLVGQIFSWCKLVVLYQQQ